MNCVSGIRIDLLEILGSGYVIDYCVSAFSEKKKNEAYRIYVTDSLYSIANMYSRSHGGEMAMEKRYLDVMEIMEKKEEKPEVTAEEVIERMRAKLRR